MKQWQLRLIAPLFKLFTRMRRAKTYEGELAEPNRWYRGALEGYVCADGSPYSVYYKKGQTNKLVVYFSGGGASWNAETAMHPNTLESVLNAQEGYYFPNLPDYLDLLLAGILAEKPDPRNPVNGWNVLYIPYATGDFHVGNADFAYSGPDGTPRTLHHHGARNAAAALDALPPAFSAPEQILVAGDSAGIFGCLAHAPDIARRFPGCPSITVYADGAQLHVPGPFWRQVVKDVWCADERFWSCIGEDGQLAVDWFMRAARKIGERATLLHSTSRFDETAAAFQNKMRHGDYSLGGSALQEYHEGLAQACMKLARECPNYAYYIANHDYNPEIGTTAHTSSRWPKRFYVDSVEGVSVAQWLASALRHGKGQCVGRAYLDD